MNQPETVSGYTEEPQEVVAEQAAPGFTEADYAALREQGALAEAGIQESDAQQARFLAIVQAVKGEQGISNEDALFLLQIITGLEYSNAVSQKALNLLGSNIIGMFEQLGADCMRRVGRSDFKTKRSMKKICASYVSSLFALTQQQLAEELQAAQPVVAETATTPPEPTQEDQDRASKERSEALLAALEIAPDSLEDDLVGSNPDEVVG